MSTPVRQRRGYGTLALGLAALTAAAGGLYWYLSREGALESTWFRPGTRVKRKSVVIVLDEVHVAPCLRLTFAEYPQVITLV